MWCWCGITTPPKLLTQLFTLENFHCCSDLTNFHAVTSLLIFSAISITHLSVTSKLQIALRCIPRPYITWEQRVPMDLSPSLFQQLASATSPKSSSISCLLLGRPILSKLHGDLVSPTSQSSIFCCLHLIPDHSALVLDQSLYSWYI